jgi:hypothetical protein
MESDFSMKGFIEGRLGVTKPKNIIEINPGLIQKVVEKLNIVQRLNLKIWGSVFVDNVKFGGWTESVPIYLFKCDIHGYELNYPSGHGMNLLCLDCIRERLEKLPDASKMIHEKYFPGITSAKPYAHSS